MSREEKIITIQDRKQELTFKIREMPAIHLERWIGNATVELAKAGAASGTQLAGASIQDTGAFIAGAGLQMLGHIDSAKAWPLLDEMLGCCSRMVENVEERCTVQSVESYIFDVKTLFTLRKEALKMNLGFFKRELERCSGSQESDSSVMQ